MGEHTWCRTDSWQAPLGRRPTRRPRRQLSVPPRSSSTPPRRQHLRCSTHTHTHTHSQCSSVNARPLDPIRRNRPRVIIIITGGGRISCSGRGNGRITAPGCAPAGMLLHCYRCTSCICCTFASAYLQEKWAFKNGNPVSGKESEARCKTLEPCNFVWLNFYTYIHPIVFVVCWIIVRCYYPMVRFSKPCLISENSE